MLPLYIENVPDKFNQISSNHFKFSLGLLRISLVRVTKGKYIPNHTFG